MSKATPSVATLFEGKMPVTQAIYDRLITELQRFGAFKIEAKKTSIHLVRKTGFAGVHPQKAAIHLNLRLSNPIEHARITKTEQVSKNRWHLNVKLNTPEDVNAELLNWLKDAYELGA